MIITTPDGNNPLAALEICKEASAHRLGTFVDPWCIEDMKKSVTLTPPLPAELIGQYLLDIINSENPAMGLFIFTNAGLHMANCSQGKKNKPAIPELERILHTPVWKQSIDLMQESCCELLRLAGLLHNINGDGDPERSSIIAETILDRLGVEKELTEKVGWIISVGGQGTPGRDGYLRFGEEGLKELKQFQHAYNRNFRSGNKKEGGFLSVELSA